MEYLPIVLIIVAIVGFIAWHLLTRRKYKAVWDRVFAIKNKVRSPNGVHIWIESNANCTEPEMMAIEKGLNDCFAKARLRGYDRPLNLSDYIVAIIGDSERSPESQTWSFRIPPAQYKGTEWDMGGYILAGGQVIAAGQPYGNIIALPDHRGTDLDELATVTMYEAEHVILSFCDGDLYEATKTHLNGQGHPIF